MTLVLTQKVPLYTCSEYVEWDHLSSLTPQYHVIALLINFQLSAGIAMMTGLKLLFLLQMYFYLIIYVGKCHIHT